MAVDFLEVARSKETLCVRVWRWKAIDVSGKMGRKSRRGGVERWGEWGVAGRPMLGRPAHFYGQNGGAGEDMVTSPSAFCCIKIKFSDHF